MTTTLPPICLWCVHHHGQQSITTCDAFPEGIPEEVMSASADHMEPIPGDSGITFVSVQVIPHLDASAFK